MASKKIVSIPDFKKELVTYTRKRLQSVLMLLAMNVGELSDPESFDDMQPNPEFSIPHRDAILSAIKKLDITLIAQSETRDALLREITAQRNNLVADAKVLLACLDRIDATMHIMQDTFTLRGLESIPPRVIQREVFLEDCMKFMAHMAASHEEAMGLGALMPCFPFKMAREKVYDYVQSALSKQLSRMPEAIAAELLDAFFGKLFPEQTKGYTSLFSSFTTRTAAFAANDIASMTEEELESLHETSSELAEDLEMAFEALEPLHETYQFLIILLTFADSAENLTEDDPVLKDAFFATIESLLNNEYDAFRDNLLNTIDEKLSTMLEDVNKTWNKLRKTLESLDPDEADDELAALLSVRNIVDSLFLEEFRTAPLDHAPKADSAPLTPEQATVLASGFINRIKSALEALPPKEQKALRRNLFLLTPHDFGPEEFHAYLQSAYDAADGFTQQAMVVEKVGRAFEDFNYNPPDKDVHEHHHHHGDDCDCGHHHHHDDDCDCGHHHHH